MSLKKTSFHNNVFLLEDYCEISHTKSIANDGKASFKRWYLKSLHRRDKETGEWLLVRMPVLKAWTLAPW